MIAFEYLSLCALYAPRISSLDWPRDLVVFVFFFFSSCKSFSPPLLRVVVCLLVPSPNKYPYLSSALFFPLPFAALAHIFSLSLIAFASTNPSIFLAAVARLLLLPIVFCEGEEEEELISLLRFVIKSATVFLFFSFAGRMFLLFLLVLLLVFSSSSLGFIL